MGLKTPSGRSIPIGKQVAKGGQGEIFTITGSPKAVLKKLSEKALTETRPWLVGLTA